MLNCIKVGVVLLVLIREEILRVPVATSREKKRPTTMNNSVEMPDCHIFGDIFC